MGKNGVISGALVQPPISGPFDSAHTSQPPFWRHPPPRFVSEQQRTLCFSLGSAHRAASEQFPARPHSTLRRAVGAGEGGAADGGGGDGDAGSAGDSAGQAIVSQVWVLCAGFVVDWCILAAYQ